MYVSHVCSDTCAFTADALESIMRRWHSAPTVAHRSRLSSRTWRLASCQRLVRTAHLACSCSCLYSLFIPSQALAAEWKALDEVERLPYAEIAAERTAAAPPRPVKAPKASKASKRAAPSPDLDSEPESQDADIDAVPAKKPALDTAGEFDW